LYFQILMASEASQTYRKLILDPFAVDIVPPEPLSISKHVEAGLPVAPQVVFDRHRSHRLRSQGAGKPLPDLPQLGPQVIRSSNRMKQVPDSCRAGHNDQVHIEQQLDEVLGRLETMTLRHEDFESGEHSQRQNFQKLAKIRNKLRAISRDMRESTRIMTSGSYRRTRRREELKRTIRHAGHF